MLPKPPFVDLPHGRASRRPVFSLVTLLAALLVSSAGYSMDSAHSGHSDSAAFTGKARQLHCMAMNIYHEGRGESAAGQAAIAAVTMNRVRSARYPDSVCEVVWQRKQFSWTRLAPHRRVIDDRRAWQEALAIAETFLNGAHNARVGDATHYHAVHVRPGWTQNSRLVALIGRHVFYTL